MRLVSLIKSLEFHLFLGSLAISTSYAGSAELFPLESVTLTEGPLLKSQELNLEYVLSHDVDRFVAPFRREASLPKKAEPYPNWESTGLDGHSAGHYLTALAQHAVVSRSTEAEERLEYMVAELAACQEAFGNGYLGGFPGGTRIWDEMIRGNMKVDNFSLNGAWVPWYNIHKTFAGMRDAWLLTSNMQARKVLEGMGRWCLEFTDSLSDEDLQKMLQCEHGGMNEVLADLFEITGDGRYLEAARRFSHWSILSPLLNREDKLDGLHANTQIPKVIGFARVAELENNPDWWEASDFFWDRLVNHRSVAIGGNSVREHFHPVNDFGPMIRSREGPETCNTYNMMRLSEQLFRMQPSVHYADYYELALYNHIRSSQHPNHGGYVYFTPMRPSHYRVYSKAESCFWCCVGSGMENHGKYGRFIYAHDEDTLYVNLFIASRLEWDAQGLVVQQDTRFPEQEKTTLKLNLKKTKCFSLALRHPAWIPEGELKVYVNGELHPARSEPSSYLEINRKWKSGDCIEISLPMHTALEFLPDNSGYAAITYGPIVLGSRIQSEDTPELVADDARMGHVAPGSYIPLNHSPMLVGEVEDIIAELRPVKDAPVHFKAEDVIRPKQFNPLVLEPFSGIHDSRYMVYWKVVPENSYDTIIQQLAEDERFRLALEARTLDQVQPGEQQPEVEHSFKAEGPLQGTHLGRTWRGAEKWFEYQLNAGNKIPSTLQLVFYDAERGRKFDVLINGEMLTTIQLDGGDPDLFIDQEFPLTESMVEATRKGPIKVRFVAHEGSIAGAIYGLRLLAKEGNTVD